MRCKRRSRTRTIAVVIMAPRASAPDTRCWRRSPTRIRAAGITARRVSASGTCLTRSSRARTRTTRRITAFRIQPRDIRCKRRSRIRIRAAPITEPRASAPATKCRRRFRTRPIAEHRALLRVDSRDRAAELTSGAIVLRCDSYFGSHHERQARRTNRSLGRSLVERPRAGTFRRCCTWGVVWRSGTWANRGGRGRSRRLYRRSLDRPVLGDAALLGWNSLPDYKTGSSYTEASSAN
jgi:hypothetical protein